MPPNLVASRLGAFVGRQVVDVADNPIPDGKMIESLANHHMRKRCVIGREAARGHEWVCKGTTRIVVRLRVCNVTSSTTNEASLPDTLLHILFFGYSYQNQSFACVLNLINLRLPSLLH